jgi:hypothetical protein
MNRVLPILAGLVILLFAVVWGWIAFKLWDFQPTPEKPTLIFTNAQVTVAGFLASAVGAGTASVLGIEIQKAPASDGQTIAVQVGEAAQGSRLLFAGIVLYAIVGVAVLLVWLSKSSGSPDMVGAFSLGVLGVLGWLGGAFAAVFRKST